MIIAINIISSVILMYSSFTLETIWGQGTYGVLGGFPDIGSENANVTSSQPAFPDKFRVIHTYPIAGASGFGQTSSIKVTFNEPVREDTVNNFWIGLTTPPVVLGTAATGKTSLSTDGKTLTFTPSVPLISGTSHTAVVKAGLKNTDHEALGSDYRWSFITGGSPNPNTCNNLIAHPKTITGVTAKSSESASPPRNAIDKDLNTKWVSTSVLKPWIKADLGNKLPMCKVDIAWADGASRQNSFIISVSLDGTNFVKVFSGKNSGTTTSPERYSFAETNARYVRIMLSQNTNSVAQIAEMAVIGRYS